MKKSLSGCLLVISMFFPNLGMASITQDMEITKAVYNAMNQENDIPAKIKASSRNGVVRLVGMVDTTLQVHHITEIASSVKGVTDVNIDKLKVKNSKEFLSDAFITAKSKGRIKYLALNDKIAPGYELHIETTNQVVHIWGKVKNEGDIKVIKDSIEDIIDVDAVKLNILYK
ncbi:MAG: BON domain-containing protein [Rickettsiaceae bacterium]|nr:BON domain-containing protein [Rickettsiaceae bacterium]